MFIRLLTALVNGSNHTKCMSLSNQKCMTQPTLINIHPKEYSQELRYYLFVVELCVPNKTEDLILSVFNMISGINESKTLAKTRIMRM